MKTVGLYEAKTNLSALVQEVETTGESIHLTRHGKIVAEITPPSPIATPKRGCLQSQNFKISSDFDDSEIGFEDFYDADDLNAPINTRDTTQNKVAEPLKNYISAPSESSSKA